MLKLYSGCYALILLNIISYLVSISGRYEYVKTNTYNYLANEILQNESQSNAVFIQENAI